MDGVRHARALAPAGAWIVTRGLMVAFLFHELRARPSGRWLPFLITNDVTVDYFRAASKLASGLTPYRSFIYEYPPGTLPFLAIAHWRPSDTVFLGTWLVLMLVLDAATAFVLFRWSRVGSGRGALWLWIAAVTLLGPLVLVRNDMIVASAVVTACWLSATSRFGRAGAVWAFAVLAKLWPLAPFVMYAVASRRGRRRLLVGAAAVTITAIVWLAAWRALGPMVHDLVMRHGHRPLELETSWAITLMLIAAAHGVHLRHHTSYGSLNLATGVAPGWMNAVAYRLSYVLEIAGIAAVVALRRLHRREVSPVVVAWLVLALVAASLAAAPVLSPQYVLWLIAAGCCVLAVERTPSTRIAAAAVCVTAALTQFDYPLLFNHIVRGQLDGLIVTETRNLLLVGIAAHASVVAVRRARTLTPDAVPRQAAVEPRTTPASDSAASSPNR
jgi:hypothetical protein